MVSQSTMIVADHLVKHYRVASRPPGLVAALRSTVRRFVRSYCDRHGATVLLTSHNMADVAGICERIIAIDRGRLRFDGSLPELRLRLRPYKRLELRLERRVEAEQLAELGEVVEHEDARAVVRVASVRLKQTVERALQQLPVSDLTATDAPLEEVLADLFRRPPGAGEDGDKAGEGA